MGSFFNDKAEVWIPALCALRENGSSRECRSPLSDFSQCSQSFCTAVILSLVQKWPYLFPYYYCTYYFSLSFCMDQLHTDLGDKV